MSSLVEPLLVFLVLANLVLVGTSRLALCIRVLALQGLALGLLPVLLPDPEHVIRAALLAAVSLLLKGIVLPRLLARALRAADVRHEVEPLVGYGVSVLAGVLALGLSLWLGPRLNAFAPGTGDAPRLLLPAALFTVLTGLFLVVSRKTALNQVMGYLALENGVYLAGLALARAQPLLVELGVLLDLFVAVFVMGIIIFHIHREFDHIDVDQLSTLKD